MWIGVAVVVMMTGEMVTDASAFKTEAECLAETVKVTAKIEQYPGAFAYHAECFDAEKYLTVNKIEPPKQPQVEPPKKTDS